MDLKSIAARAKGLIERRGGTGSLKQDASELREVAGGRGSATDKAKAAAEALREPGANDEPIADTTAPGVAAGERARGRSGGRRRGGGRG